MTTGRSTPARQDFAKLLASSGVFGAAFLPIEQAEWRGNRYTLGNSGRRTPRDLFVGARLQSADPRNLDRSRERAVQHDFAAVVKSIMFLRRQPGLESVVLSPEMIVGRDPGGIKRVRFGLANPANGDFINESAGVAECHAQLARAVRSTGLSIASQGRLDPTSGFAGLQAWAEGIRLRPSRRAAALWWGRTAAMIAAVTFGLSTIPAVTRGVRSAFDTAWNTCLGAYAHLFPKLEAPRGAQATQGDFTDRVEVKWWAVDNATGYAVYRDDMSVPLALVSGREETSFSDEAAEVGKDCSYAVRATTMFTHGGLSEVAHGHRNIDAPTGVSASAGTTKDSVLVRWKPVDGAEAYVVLRDTGGSEESISTAAVESLKDDAAPAGVECRYRVQTKRGVATSRPSSPIAIGYRGVSPPSGLAASDGTNSDGIDVTWNEVDGATAYRLTRSPSTSSTSTGNSVECLSAPYRDRAAKPGVTYSYRVTAVTPAGGETAASASDDGWRGFVKTNAAATQGTFTDRVAVEWNPVPGADGYEILRDGQPEPIGKTVGSDATSFEDHNASTEKKHPYVIRPVVSQHEAPTSKPAVGWRALPPPARLIASRGFRDRVVVEWESIPEAARFDVLRDGTEIGTVDGEAKSQYVDRTAEIGRMYRYSVASVSGDNGPGPASRPAEGYRNLGQPQDVRVESEGGVPVVKWKAVEGANRYEILRSDNDKGPQGFADHPPWLDDQPSDSPVTYRVRARTDTVTGPESEPVQFGMPD